MGGQERWKGRLEAVNTERTAKKGFVSGGHRCVCACVLHSQIMTRTVLDPSLTSVQKHITE